MIMKEQYTKTQSLSWLNIPGKPGEGTHQSTQPLYNKPCTLPESEACHPAPMCEHPFIPL